MYILNKKTKTIQECRNADAIKACREDAARYVVAETAEELKALAGKVQEKEQEAAQEPEQEENTTEAGKAAPGAPGEATEGEKEHEGDADPAQEPEAEQDGGEDPEAELTKKSVNDLRKIAKDKGITGYNNMNKQTLVAMILNH